MSSSQGYNQPNESLKILFGLKQKLANLSQPATGRATTNYDTPAHDERSSAPETGTYRLSYSSDDESTVSGLFHPSNTPSSSDSGYSLHSALPSHDDNTPPPSLSSGPIESEIVLVQRINGLQYSVMELNEKVSILDWHVTDLVDERQRRRRLAAIWDGNKNWLWWERLYWALATAFLFWVLWWLATMN